MRAGAEKCEGALIGRAGPAPAPRMQPPSKPLVLSSRAVAAPHADLFGFSVIFNMIRTITASLLITASTRINLPIFFNQLRIFKYVKSISLKYLMIHDKVNDKEKLQSQQYNRIQKQYKKNNFAYKTNDLTYFLYYFCFYIILSISK